MLDVYRSVTGISMKVISVLQPWAYLLASGHKEIETRSWNTIYRGPILIHASQKKMRNVDHEMYEAWVKRFGIPKKRFLPHNYGAIIGQVNIVRVEVAPPSYFPLSQKELSFGNFSAGRHLWHCENAQLFSTPVPVKGRLGIWEFKQPGVWIEIDNKR